MSHVTALSYLLVPVHVENSGDDVLDEGVHVFLHVAEGARNFIDF